MKACAVQDHLNDLENARKAQLDVVNRQFDALKSFYEAILNRIGMW